MVAALFDPIEMFLNSFPLRPMCELWCLPFFGVISLDT
jgi:hypothetical protein